MERELKALIAESYPEDEAAVDRDLGSLVASGDVKKLAGGALLLSSQESFRRHPTAGPGSRARFSQNNRFPADLPNHYNQLGLGLTQVYNTHLVYNHKRSGDCSLGGKNFKFRVGNEVDWMA